jgi:hypothetical protein
MVENSTRCSYENIDALSQLSNLILDIDSAVHSHDSELTLVMLQFDHLVRHLESELSSWGQNDGLNFPGAEQFLSSQILDSRKTESECFSGPCEISRNEVPSLVHWVKTMLLNRE